MHISRHASDFCSLWIARNSNSFGLFTHQLREWSSWLLFCSLRLDGYPVDLTLTNSNMLPSGTDRVLWWSVSHPVRSVHISRHASEAIGYRDEIFMWQVKHLIVRHSARVSLLTVQDVFVFFPDISSYDTCFWRVCILLLRIWAKNNPPVS